MTVVCAHCGSSFQGPIYARYCCTSHKQAAYRQRKKRKQEQELISCLPS